MTTIVLADDHHVVRQGLRTLLQAEPDFDIIGEAADGWQAIQLVEHLRPQVLVLDLMMPGLGGLEVTRRLSQQSASTRVVILSMYANNGYVSETLKNGAAAYVLKSSTADELVRAVREVIAGRRYLSPPLSEKTLETFLERATESVTDPYELLTPRQREVLHLIVEGHTTAEIAAQLVVSPRTIEFHRANLMRKLRARNQADLVRYTLRRNLMPPE